MKAADEENSEFSVYSLIDMHCIHLLVYLSLQSLQNQEVEKAHARNAAVNKVFIHNQLKRKLRPTKPWKNKKSSRSNTRLTR